MMSPAQPGRRRGRPNGNSSAERQTQSEDAAYSQAGVCNRGRIWPATYDRASLSTQDISETRNGHNPRFPGRQEEDIVDNDSIRVLVQLEDPDAGEIELERATTRVRSDLLQLEVDSVEQPAAGPAPPGTKAVELAAVGALLVTAQQGWQVLGGIVEQVRAWASRGPGRSVTVSLDGDSITVTGSSDENERLLIEGWLERKRGEAGRSGQA